MNRISNWWMSIMALALTIGAPVLTRAQIGKDVRQLKISVSHDAPPEIQEAAQRVLAAVQTHPLLREMAAEYAPRFVVNTAELAGGPVTGRAYSHLVVIGLPDDPLIKAAWQREARSLKGGGWYAFGYGNFVGGGIGWIESDRNPFLHGAAIPTAPFETHVVTLTGTTPAGVTLAVNAFLDDGLTNGLVAAPGWKRGGVTLLDHEPLTLPAKAPLAAPVKAGEYSLVGWTQPNEEEYRGVEDDAGVAPQVLARFKYYKAGDWDYAGAKFARTAYHLGLHRRSFGNTLWAAKFSDAGEAAGAARRIASSARLKAESGGLWKGAAAPHSEDKDEPASGLTLWSNGSWVFMSTLPGAATGELRGSMEAVVR